MLDKIKTALSAIKADLKDTYDRYKLVIYGALAAIGYLLFTQIKDAILVYLGKKEAADTKAKDATLASQEKTDNDQADALVKHANEAPSQEKPVDDNWYKK